MSTHNRQKETPIEFIVIGGSAGALEALMGSLLPALPRDFSVPMALVIHLPPTEPSYVAAILADKCSLAIRDVEDKEPIVAKTLYVAPPNYHLLIEKKTRTFSLSVDEPIHYSRPAIDVLFESAAEAFGSALVAVLLSGANRDGAAGLLRVKQMGGKAIVQSPETSIAPTMPEAALQTTAVDRVVPSSELGSCLVNVVNEARAHVEHCA